MSKIRSSFALLAGCALALSLGGTALAADMGMPTKAPPMAAPPAPPPLDIHGFVEFDYSSFFINPQGQQLGTHGAETLVTGLNWTLYKDKAGFINNITVGGLAAIDFDNSFQGYWAAFQPSANGAVFDMVWQANLAVTFGQYWTLSDAYTQVWSQDVAGLGSPDGLGIASVNGAGVPCGSPKSASGGVCSGFGYLQINELRLTLNDSFTGWWITFNPYVDWYVSLPSGGGTFNSPACFTCGTTAGATNGGQAYDFLIGMNPTVSLKQWGFPQWSLRAPTYFTVGPRHFWDGDAPGASNSSFGIFTTGLTATYSLTWIPANYGSWYVKGGFQYYDMINNALLTSAALSLCGLTATPATCSNAKRDVVLGFAGIGVGF